MDIHSGGTAAELAATERKLAAEADRKQRIMIFRDQMLSEIRALENKVAGIDMALKLLGEPAPIAGARQAR